MAKRKFNGFLTFILCVVFFAIFFVGAGYGYLFFKSQDEISKIKVYTDGSIEFHFLELGNKYTGDCTYIKAGETDILIDAGSRPNSASTIKEYVDNHVIDGKLEYVIVTHADQDHIAAFAGDNTNPSLFTYYQVETIIDFALTNKTTAVYNRYLNSRDEEIAEGAKHYTALDCVEQTNGASKVYDLGNSITMEILEHKFYKEESDDENNYSVCTLFTQGERNFLLTGDLEIEGEESLALLNDLPKCELFKAGHHGSKTSSNDVILQEIQPKVVCVCCCCGNYEYTQNNANNFPTQDMINRVANYTELVYVTTLGLPRYDEGEEEYKNDQFTSMNGNIVVTSNSAGFNVNCSNNNLILKETEWFKQNRTCPEAWQ